MRRGLGDGFLGAGGQGLLAYKGTEVYHPEAGLGVGWDDLEVGISWPIAEPLVSEKDRALPKLSGIDRERLPGYGG